MSLLVRLIDPVMARYRPTHTSQFDALPAPTSTCSSSETASPLARSGTSGCPKCPLPTVEFLVIAPNTFWAGLIHSGGAMSCAS